MKTKFLSISLAVTLMLLGAGFFVRSIGTANAAPTKSQKSTIDITSKTGKYAISLTYGNMYVYATALNTETGKSETYYYYTESAGNWIKMTAKLPDFTF